MKKKLLLAVVILSILTGCVMLLPTAARDFAISALCEYPAFSGRNLCKKVEIIDYQRISVPPQTAQIDEKQLHWCLDIQFIDYTGESGQAAIWIVGPNNAGKYILEKGPLYGGHCRD